MKSNVLKLTLLASLLSVPAIANAGAVTGGATFPEQIVQEVTASMQYAKQIEQYAKQAQQLETTISMYENQVTNMTQIPNQLWQKMTQPLAQLVSVVSQGQALAMNASNIGQQFQNMYQGFKPGISASDYNNWLNSNNDQLQGALETQNLSVQDFQNSAQALSTIENESPAGRAGLLNVANQIAGNEAGSLQQLGSMVAAQEHAQDNYMAFQIAHEKSKDGSNQKWARDTADVNNVPNALQ